MISMDKQYQTRDGRPVRLLCVDGNDPTYPVVGFVGDNVGITKWCANGNFTSAGIRLHRLNLVEVKQVKTVKSLCWRNSEDGYLIWRLPVDRPAPDVWQRFPAGDIEGEVDVWQRFPAGDIEGEVEDD